MELSYGADPETFLSIGEKYISAHGILPGTKAEPFKVEKGAIQVDGLAFEFNIDPAKTADEFDRNITVVLAQMDEMVKKIDKDIKINFIPLAKFEKKYFDHLPQECKLLGCDPDFSSVDGSVNIPSKDLSNIPIRTAAGHVHIGWTKDQDPMDPVHFEDARFIANKFYTSGWGLSNPFRVKTVDEAERLKYYGANGSFRPKSYGVELRQFSNLWVKRSDTRKQMFNYIDSDIKKMAK